jgi:ATP-dependent Clp protease ATP-binding subunit ClpA
LTVSVPATHKSGALQIQTEITSLTNGPQNASTQQLLKLRQEHLVLSLLDEQRLDAGSILSTIAYNTAKLPADLKSKITYLTSAAAGVGMPAVDAAAELVSAQRQAVIELMANQAISAASILSTMTFIGGAKS